MIPKEDLKKAGFMEEATFRPHRLIIWLRDEEGNKFIVVCDTKEGVILITQEYFRASYEGEQIIFAIRDVQHIQSILDAIGLTIDPSAPRP